MSSLSGALMGVQHGGLAVVVKETAGFETRGRPSSFLPSQRFEQFLERIAGLFVFV